jgi:hypothetical protein
MAINESYARAKAEGLVQVTSFITPAQKEKLRLIAAYENSSAQRITGKLIDAFFDAHWQDYKEKMRVLYLDDTSDAN